MVLFVCVVDSHRLPGFQIAFNVEAFQWITSGKNATSKLQNMHSALERYLIYDGTTKIMVTHQPCLWLDPVPRLVSTTLPSKSPQADIFLINSPCCKWPQQKIWYIMIHPYNYPYVFLHLQLITYQVFFATRFRSPGFWPWDQFGWFHQTKVLAQMDFMQQLGIP